MEDKEILAAREKSINILDKKQTNRTILNRSDRVHWEEIKSNKTNRIRSGVIINIIHDDIESFLDDAYFLLNTRIKNALKKHNTFEICTVLCVQFNSKKTSVDENVKTDYARIHNGIDIELWYNNNVERPIVNKLKQLQSNNRRMQLEIMCLVVCFTESESKPAKNNYIRNNYASTSASSNVEKIQSPILAKPLVALKNNNIEHTNNGQCSNSHRNTYAAAHDVIFYHQNMQSIGNKIEQLQTLAHKRKFDFILLSEHWITSDDDIPDIDGYHWASTYRRKCRLRGGAAILVREHQRKNVTVQNDINRMSEETVIELSACLWRDRNLIILALYRPPNGSIPTFLNILERVLEKVINKNKLDIIIGGDFNIDFLLKEDSATKRLLNMLSSYKLLVTIQQYTRVRLRTKKCIDNIITNLQNVKSRVIDADISDHYGQEMLLLWKKPNNNNNNPLPGRIMLDACV